MNDRLPTLAERVRAQTGATWSRARGLCEEGRVSVDGEPCRDPAMRVGAAAIVAIDERGPKLRPGPLADSAIVHADRDLVVLDKPAGMLSVADEEGNKDTLAHHARTLLRRKGGRELDAKLGVVHRLDRDTSGLMMFARNAAAHRLLAAQFRDHDVERVYLAIAHGDVPARRIETWLLPDRGDGLRGSFGHHRRARGDPPPEARQSITHLTPVETLRGATLVECCLETGRQHQIRIHLAELGHPLVGERVYIRDYAGPRIEAPRPMLHARTLGFTHPRNLQAMSLERGPPADFRDFLFALGGRTLRS